jgi:hypothetical protein
VLAERGQGSSATNSKPLTVSLHFGAVCRAGLVALGYLLWSTLC